MAVDAKLNLGCAKEEKKQLLKGLAETINAVRIKGNNSFTAMRTRIIWYEEWLSRDIYGK